MNAQSAGLVQVSGDSQDAWFEGTLPVGQGSAPGECPLRVAAGDRAGNQATYERDQLQSAGWPYALQVVSRGADTAGPTLVDLDLVTPTVDSRDGGAAATVRVRLTDPGAGVQFGYVGGHLAFETRSLSVGPVQLVSGDVHDGWWELNFPVPQYTVSENWDLWLSCSDNKNNNTIINVEDLAIEGFPSTLFIQALTDDSPPVLSDLTLSADALDVAAPRTASPPASPGWRSTSDLMDQHPLRCSVADRPSAGA